MAAAAVPGLGGDLLAVGLSPLQPLPGGVAGRLQHAGRLVAQGLHHMGGLDLPRRGGLEVDDARLERVDQATETADLGGGLTQPPAHRLRFEAAADRVEVGALELFGSESLYRIQSFAVCHGSSDAAARHLSRGRHPSC